MAIKKAVQLKKIGTYERFVRVLNGMRQKDELKNLTCSYIDHKWETTTRQEYEAAVSKKKIEI